MNKTLKITSPLFNDMYFIEASDSQYTLMECKEVQDKESNNYGTTYCQPKGYYTSLGSCLARVSNLLVLNSPENTDSVTLESYVNQVTELRTKLINYFKL